MRRTDIDDVATRSFVYVGLYMAHGEDVFHPCSKEWIGLELWHLSVGNGEVAVWLCLKG